MSSRSRRDARERALELLYEAQAKGISPSALLTELAIDPDPYAVELVRGVAEDADRVDTVIASHLRADWRLDRIATVDRAILQLATIELQRRNDVPTAVVLSEAVELAKRYSTEESGRFVNGILAAIAAEVRPG